MKEIIDSTSWSPINVIWELTLSCNLRCKHCGSAAGKCRKDELTLDRALSLCDKFKELGTKEVTLIGGEPLISNKWFPVSMKLKDLGIKVNFVSNAVLVNEEVTEKLKEANINNFGISIEGKETTNDLIRGKGVYKKIIRAIKLLQKKKIPVSIATTVSRMNFQELDSIYKSLVKLKIKVWQLQLAIPVGRMTEELMLKKADLKSLVEFIIKVRNERKLRIFTGCNIGYFGGFEEKYRIQKGEKALPFWTGCYSGIFEVGIMSNGSVKGCLAMKDRFIEGNIRNKPLREIWEKKDAFSYNRKFRKDNLSGFCRKCEFGEICRGGCPIISEALTGSFNNDPYCIERIQNVGALK